MQCELCRNNEALIRIAGSVNEEETSINLCQRCAAKNKVDAAALSRTTLTEFFEHYEELCRELKGDLAFEYMKCPECGLTREEFAAHSRPGCAFCAVVFREDLQHVEPEPPRESAPELQRRLEKAVAREAYEEAAVLRDRIRALQGKPRGV